MSAPAVGWSLVRRLVIWLLAILFASALLQIAVAYRSMLEEADEFFDYQLQQTAQALVSAAPSSGPAVLEREHGQADELDLIILERGAAGERRTNAPGVLPDHMQSGYADLRTRLGTLRVYTVAESGRQVSVGQRLAARRDLAREVAAATLWPLLVLAAASLLLLFIVLRAALRPITRLQHQIQAREAASLKPLDDPGLPAELSTLLEAANDLIRRLSEVLDHQRRFLANAAHELRTPISAVRLQNTLVGKAETASERQEALTAQAAGIQRASQLVDQLLRLSRLEAWDAPVQDIAFDLSDELRALVSLHASEAAANEITLHFSVPKTPVQGDPTLCAAVFGNLIGNAVHHCPPGSHVHVHLETAEQGIVVTVDDDGPGIPADEVDALLQPFRRGGSAHATGSGLGLAIVQAACVRAGWRMRLERSPQGGLRAAVHVRRSSL